MIKSHAFTYEEFCGALLKHLKENELKFISFSPESIIPSRIKEEQLRNVLEDFWNQK